MEILKQSENSLNKVQGLKAKHDYNEALSLCFRVLENLKPVALQTNDTTDDLQLMAIAIGEISEIYEKKNDIQHALEYKKLQRYFLSYAKYQEPILCEDLYGIDEEIQNKKDLIDKLNEIQEITISLSDDPKDAMAQIIESLQRSKEKKVNSTLKSIMSSQNTNRQRNDDIKLTRLERFIEFIFNHPFLFILFILAILLFLIFLVLNHFQTKIEISENTKKRIKDISNHISKIINIKPTEKDMDL